MIEMVCDQNGLDAVCKKVCELSSNSGVIFLQGKLASGKTTLVKAYAKMLGLSEAITSPTFLVMQSYGDALFHYDLYNKELESFLALGLLEELLRDGIHFVEWGDERLQRLLNSLGKQPLVVKIETLSAKRRYLIDA